MDVLPGLGIVQVGEARDEADAAPARIERDPAHEELTVDRKSTRLNSSHLGISYAVFCLKKKKIEHSQRAIAPPLAAIAPPIALAAELAASRRLGIEPALAWRPPGTLADAVKSTRAIQR